MNRDDLKRLRRACATSRTSVLRLAEFHLPDLLDLVEKQDAALKAAEWSGDVCRVDGRERCCPVCRRCEVDGHTDDCPIGQARMMKRGETNV